jgi:hypothetical protein
MAVAQEGHRTTWIQTSDGSLDWILHPAAACSSKVFPLYYHMTWKGFFNDTSDVLNDSCQYMVQLFTSSTALTTIDTTFTLAHTVFNAPAEFDGDSTIAFWGGPTRPKSMFEAAERFGFFRITVLSTGSQIDSAIIGRMYINGWSNQSGAVLSKIGN